MPSNAHLYKGLCLWALLLACAGCASLSSDPFSKYSDEQLRQIGERFLAARDMGQGLKFLAAAEARRPNDPKIQYLLALGYEERGMDNEALAHFQKALELKPDFSEAYNALGSFYARKGLNDKAEDAFKKALSNPFYETPHLAAYNLGLIYESKGDKESALKAFRETVRLATGYGLAYYHIGLILESQNRADEAREAYGQAIKGSPNLPEAHLRYGIMCYMAGEIEPALYSLNRVVRLAPDSALALEAKRYLTRMRSVIENSPETTVPSGTSSEKLRRFDVMTRQDLLERNSSVPVAPKGTQSESKGKISIPSTAWLPTGPDTPQPDSESGQMKSVEAPGSGPQETIQGSPEPVGSEAQVPVADNQPMTFEPQWQYVVQIGSFVDKKAAESEKDKLKQRGYSVTVKSMKHQVLGQVYVVQLKPVSSAAKANTLMTQLETAEQTKPVLIKLPAN